MTDFTNGLNVQGAFSAGNIAYGTVSINPTANTPTSTSVSGLSLAGSGDLTPIVTAVSSVPGTTVREVSVTSVGTTSFDVVLYRENTTTTWVNWFVIRKPS